MHKGIWLFPRKMHKGIWLVLRKMHNGICLVLRKMNNTVLLGAINNRTTLDDLRGMHEDLTIVYAYDELWYCIYYMYIGNSTIVHVV